ncbi:MAG: FAD-dependent oxidoreductase [Chloroflexota bacterium]
MPIPIIRYATELPPRADVVVVGGGIVGCATAFFAARAGLDVVVLERRPALATLTTPASTGAFRLQFDNPDEIALVREGIELFDHFAERTGLDGWDLGLRHGGYLFCSLTDATLDRSHRLVERQREWGLTDVELLSGDEARYRWPWLAPALVGARYRAGDGWLDPKRLAIGYAVASGAVFCMATEATAFELTADGSRIAAVQTPRGAIAADAVVIAAGPFSAQVAARAGVRVEIATLPRQKMVIPELPAVPRDAPMTIEEETAAHWRPALHGCMALWTAAGTPASEPAEAPPIDPSWAFGLLDPTSDHALARVAPFWADVWRDGSVAWYLQSGQYEMTPDRRPYLGPAGPQGFHLNAGYSGHGIMASTGGSRRVVDLLTGAAEPEANAFRVDRPMTSREHDIL